MGARHLAKAHSLAERMFLELRFGVLSARYLPGQIIPKGELGELYECRPAAVAEVLNALAFEGYLTRQSRSEFVVRTWGAEEVEDLFEMRANLEGLAASRAATRASTAEISLLGALVAEAHEAAPDNPEDLERVIHENLRFHIEVMRMSRIPQVAEMARMALPNALHRRIDAAHTPLTRKAAHPLISRPVDMSLTAPHPTAGLLHFGRPASHRHHSWPLANLPTFLAAKCSSMLHSNMTSFPVMNYSCLLLKWHSEMTSLQKNTRK